ncbi:putative RNA-directed DNA polymerase [Tanacetum coccineum]
MVRENNPKPSLKQKLTAPKQTQPATNNHTTDDDGWTTVQRKNTKKLGDPIGRHNINFPGGNPRILGFKCTMEDVSRYGNVVDVYLAFKRTKMGSKFGFVRFKNVGNVREFEKRLKGILIGDSKLVINVAKFFKSKDKGVAVAPLPTRYQFHPYQKEVRKQFNHSFKEAVIGPKKCQEPLRQLVKVEEDKDTRLLLEKCWTGKAKNFQVLQNSWDIVSNNGDNDGSCGRLAWIIIKGLPVIVRNIGAVKAITNKFGKTLEIGRLDFNSKVLSPIKCLVLTSSMSTICQSLDVMVNKKIVFVRIFEKQFHASSFLHSDTTNDNLFDEDNPSFEEEFIGHTVEDREDEAEDSGDESCFMGNEIPPLQKAYDVPYVDSDISPCTSGLPPPPPYVNYLAQSFHGTQSDPLDLVVPFTWCLSILMNGISLNCNGLGRDEHFDPNLETEPEPYRYRTDSRYTESKYEEVNQFLIRYLWPRSHVDWAYSSSIGASGGIITMRDTRTFEVDCQFSNRNFLGVTSSWRGLSSKVGLFNVYAPQSSSLKEQLWSSIERVIADMDATWIIFGDFNVVRSLNERIGSSFDVNEANTFNDFISRSGLCDLPLGGRRFTHFDKEGRKASKLDRFIVTSVFSTCGMAPLSQFCVAREGFHDIVLDSWALSNPHIDLKDKLKKLRMDIKAWTSARIRDQNNSMDYLKNQLLEWDLKAEDGRVSDHDIAKREECLMDLDHLDQIQRDDLKQKSRIKWAIEGDENTRFFHSILKINYCNSNIKGIMVNGNWQEDPEVIKAAAFDHFSSQFKESRSSRPCFSSSRFRKISDQDACFLESPMSVEEIKEAVWGCASSKAPGPDGFNFNFIKTFWNIIKGEFLECIRFFETSGHLANGCNPSFIVLIPKRKDPLGFGDYRPISLIGCVYKIISKILANRLAKVIDTVISSNQAAFISGRQILDGVLVANEIIRMATIEKSKLLLFKVDFEKAFDSVNWPFLLDTMRQMGFGSKWRSWISSCLSSASISVLVNGSPTKEFKLERGLRQGDPLSPFLFLIVAEALQVSILEACDIGLYKGIFLAKSGANLSLLQYADDALFFGKWSRENALSLIHILRCFELASGLKVNIDKSRVMGVVCYA